MLQLPFEISKLTRLNIENAIRRHDAVGTFNSHKKRTKFIRKIGHEITQFYESTPDSGTMPLPDKFSRFQLNGVASEIPSPRPVLTSLGGQYDIPLNCEDGVGAPESFVP